MAMRMARCTPSITASGSLCCSRRWANSLYPAWKMPSTPGLSACCCWYIWPRSVSLDQKLRSKRVSERRARPIRLLRWMIRNQEVSEASTRISMTSWTSRLASAISVQGDILGVSDMVVSSIQLQCVGNALPGHVFVVLIAFGQALAAVLHYQHALGPRPAEIGGGDLQPVGFRHAINTQRTVQADAEAAAQLIGRFGIDKHIAVVTLTGDHQIGLLRMLIEGQPLDIRLDRPADTDHPGHLGGGVLSGSQGPDRFAFLADEQALAQVIHHAAFGLGSDGKLAYQLAAQFALTAVQAVLHKAPVLVVGDGIDDAVTALAQAQAVDFIQRGGNLAQFAELAAGRVDGKCMQAVVVAVAGHRQIHPRRAELEAVAHIDVVQPTAGQILQLAALQVVDRQAVALVGTQHPGPGGVARVQPDCRVDWKSVG